MLPGLREFFLIDIRVFPNSPQAMELLATDPLLPVRIVTAIAFTATICAFVYVLRHLRDTARHHCAAPGRPDRQLVQADAGPSPLNYGSTSARSVLLCWR
jgi:hypothetical protein